VLRLQDFASGKEGEGGWLRQGLGRWVLVLFVLGFCEGLFVSSPVFLFWGRLSMPPASGPRSGLDSD
jgi:hypothetical protein